MQLALSLLILSFEFPMSFISYILKTSLEKGFPEIIIFIQDVLYL